MTMTLIQRIELTSAQASFDFTSIPGTYTDLLVLMSLRATTVSSGSGTYMELNGSAANFTTRTLYGFGTGRDSFTSTDGFAGFYSGNSDTSNTFASGALYLPNYASSTSKRFSVDHAYENNASIVYMGITTGLWNNTAAITRILLKPTSGNWDTGSSVTLYGITKGSDGITTVS